MSKKGKNDKGRKSGAPATTTEEKLTEVDRAFYDLYIQDAKKKILTLRTHLQNLLVSNENIVEVIRNMTERKVNKSATLEKSINEIENQLIQLRSENAILTEEYNEAKRKTDETISDLELKSRSMCEQLCGEVKRLNGRQHACEELRNNWDNWMAKYCARADILMEKEKEHAESLREMEAKVLYEDQELKEDLLTKLTLAGEEFTGAGSTTSSNFNMRLIRENIALQKTIDQLTNSNEEMDLKIQQENELFEDNKKNIPILEKKNARLVLECQEKTNLIKLYTDQVAKLKKEYISLLCYRDQNISYKEFQMCARFRRMKLKKAVDRAGQKVKSITREIHFYDYLIEQYKSETAKVEKHLENLRSTIERSLSLKDHQYAMNVDTPAADLIQREKNERKDMLSIILELLHIDFDPVDPGRRASIVSIDGYDRLIRFDSLFRKEAPSLSSLMDMCVQYIDSEEELGESPSSIKIARQILDRDDLFEYIPFTPGQRPLGRNYIFDVESGTSLYYSSDRRDPELALAEEQAAAADDEEEEASSSESWSAQDDDKSKETKQAPESAKTEPQQSPSPQQTATEKGAASDISGMAPGTIVDPVTEDEYEEEPILNESPYVEEDEEYDINLFY